MDQIRFIDRQTKKVHEEKVYYGELLRFLYGRSVISKLCGQPLLSLISRLPLFSALIGHWYRLPSSRRKIIPFIKQYEIDDKEFQQPADSFSSFNDFFIRKLKPDCRPIAPGEEIAVIPADARYLFYSNIGRSDGFLVKGEKFSLEQLLNDHRLAEEYKEGAMLVARLCPTDYHRFHFPIDCIPGESRLINGYLYSVNPIAIKQNIHILSRNKRVLCTLHSKNYGEVLYIEVGATNVGSIHQTYTPGQQYKKGDEKGYFSFGASTLILLFKPNSIAFDQDLLDASEKKIEIRCLMGQRMGTLSATRFRQQS